MNVAIIPDRKGSKRIKNKNIKIFFGKPVIYYSIIAAKKCKIFDKIIVSTDCKKIAKISKQYGAEALFPRPKKLSNDKADTLSVINYEIKKLLKKEKKIEFVCCIYPCSPLINHKIILKSFKKIKGEKFDYVFPASKITEPLSRVFKKGPQNKIKMLFPKNYAKKNQNLEKVYKDAGQFYLAKSLTWEKKIQIFSNSKIIELDNNHCQDIDTNEDWNLAKKKFKKLKLYN